MEGNVIKSFLVSLGFDVDDSTLTKFNKSITSATVRVASLATAVTAAAGAVGAGILQISDDFEQLGYEYKIIAPAINKAIMLRQEMFKAYSAAGVNLTKVVQASVRLNMSITKTKYALDAIYKSVGSRFFTLLTKQSDVFRQKLYQNMPKIIAALEKFVKFIFKALEAVTALGLRVWSILGRVYDFFVQLDKATDGWSTIILAVVAAWRLLNLSFLATPLGALLAGLVALVALYDDFKTFEEGGKSLFDWGPYVPVLKEIGKIFDNMFVAITGIAVALKGIFSLDFDKVLDGLVKIKDAFADTARIVGKLFSNLSPGVAGALNAAVPGLGALAAVGTALNANDASNAAANFQAYSAGGVGPLKNPLGSNSSALTNQNVNQQTQINVMGTADANAVGKAVSGEQNRVNFDMVRNMKGATR